MSTRTRTRLADTLPDLMPEHFPGFGEDASLDLPPLDAGTARQVGELFTSPEFDAWSESLAKVGNCVHPIRLHGSSETVDITTGAVVASYSSRQEPLGITLVPCGNRRQSQCPACSRVYAGDMFHLIRAGVVGGKTVPDTIVENPLVFATVTAPSFGAVHGHHPDGRRCHPRAVGRCRHRRPLSCQDRHAVDDPLLGQPLCVDCYDYASQIVWQWWAPDLWRRFTITLRRLVAKTLGVSASRLGELATVQYAKVAEYQLRGAVHFHALIRLDGPRTPQGFATAPDGIDAAVLALLVERAPRAIRLTAPTVDQHDRSRILAFGRQVDARPVRTSR